jgi:membrane protease subunit (stomatin/prohibitin family)
VRFLLVYIAEAHSADEWPIGKQISFDQHKTIEERVTIARSFAADMKQKHGFSLPMVADTIDNGFDKAYAAWPVRFYVIQEGKISFIAMGKMLGDRKQQAVKRLSSQQQQQQQQTSEQTATSPADEKQSIAAETSQECRPCDSKNKTCAASDSSYQHELSNSSFEAVLKEHKTLAAPGCEGGCVGEYNYDFRDLGAWLEQHAAGQAAKD